MKRFINIFIVIGIAFVVTSIVIMNTVKMYQEKTFPKAYEIQVQKISNLINDLVVIEDVNDFAKTVMYSPDNLSDYSEKSGVFLNQYVGISQDCSKNGAECFAKKYYNEDGKTEYIPNFEGSCAILKNGMSICIKPQIANNDITGIIDVNGISGPNIFGKDLRTFSIDAQKIKRKEIVETSDIEIYTPKDENEN